MSRSVCTNRSSMFLMSFENRPMAVTFLLLEFVGAAGLCPPDTSCQRQDLAHVPGLARVPTKSPCVVVFAASEIHSVSRATKKCATAFARNIGLREIDEPNDC